MPVSELPATRRGSAILFLRRHWVPLSASLLVAGGFFWLMHQGALPVLPDAAAQRQMSWAAIPLYALLFTVQLVVRAARWYWLLAPIHKVDMRRILLVSFVFYGATVALPFRMGEAVRPALIRQKDKLSAWAATGTVAAERVVDGLFASLILFFSLQLAQPLDPLPDTIGGLPVPAALVPQAAYSAVALFAILFVAILVFYLWRNWARRTTERVIGIASPKLATWLAEKVDRLADGFRFLPQWRYSLPFLLATAVYWFLNAFGMWFLMRAAGLEQIEFAEAMAIMGVLSLGMLVPNAPGFFGTFQISVYAGLAMYRPAHEIVAAGSVAVFWMYVLQVGLNLLGGIIATVSEVRYRPG